MAVSIIVVGRDEEEVGFIQTLLKRDKYDVSTRDSLQGLKDEVERMRDSLLPTSPDLLIVDIACLKEFLPPIPTVIITSVPLATLLRNITDDDLRLAVANILERAE